MTAPLTISEKREWARAQAKVHAALGGTDPDALARAQDELELLRQELYEGDDRE